MVLTIGGLASDMNAELSRGTRLLVALCDCRAQAAYVAEYERDARDACARGDTIRATFSKLNAMACRGLLRAALLDLGNLMTGGR